jgi:hypothetical protein
VRGMYLRAMRETITNSGKATSCQRKGTIALQL